MKLVLTTVLLSITLCSAQVQLNEVLASNTLATPDIVDFADYPDWLELKNTGDAAVNLADYYLSDDAENPYKWPIPVTASIPAKGFLLVIADGNDAAPGQVFPRGYWPWRDFTTERYHSNFALSSSGETVVLTKVSAATSSVLVHSAVPTPADASVWKYKDNGSDQSTQWRFPTFDDSAWASGPSELGYTDSPQTTVSFGPNSGSKYITTYFRHSFNVADPSAYQGLTFQLLVDDGAIVYLNGTEIIRRNLPLGDVTYQTLAPNAIGGTDENTFFPYNVPASLLVAGNNVIAAEVHQSSGGSSDLSFDLSVTGNTYTATTVDSVTYTQQVSDVSYGRDPAAPATWKQLVEPTAGAENKAAVVADVRVEGSAVTASLAGGLYTGPQTVTLTGPAGTIHYTLNGAKPTSASPVYADPLTFTTTTVLRARCFEASTAPGPILTRTYFIGETQGTLPYISVVADPETLFGDTIGIYKNTHEPTSTNFGLSDAYKGKDAPGHVEFFAPGGTSSFRANCGIRIGGENNWVHPQKALNLAVRGKYGDSDIKYNLFPDEGTSIHTGLTLRDGGDRWANEMLRDCMWPKLAHGYLKVDTADYRPSVVFINGAYYGLHDVRERWDETWFGEKYNIPLSQDNPVPRVDHLLYGHITSSSVTLGADKGDTIDWLDFMNFINTADLTNAANWTYVESRVDMESFMDFVISESYGNNTSWLHNREFWKEKKAGAKWKWFLADMDRTLSTGTTSGILADLLANEDVLKRLKLNPGFKQRLAQRYSAHMAATFTAARVQALMNQLADDISTAEVARHQTRWAPNGMTAATRAAGISGTLTYATTRAGNVHAEIVAQLGVSTAVNLTLATTGSGSVLVEGIPVVPSTFKMFPNIPINFQAVAAPGFAFSGWTGATGSETTSLTLTGAQTVTANFVPSSETVIGGTLAANTTLSAANSPYVIATDLIVPPGVTLTVEAGVAVNLSDRRNLRVQGALIINGTAALPVTVAGRSGAHWGGISFENPTVPSSLAHVIIRGATFGYDRTVYGSAVSNLNADLTLDFVDIRECESPVSGVGGSVALRDCILSNPYTGDCVNLKECGTAIQRCTFYGNNQVDSDAIDLGDMSDGVVEDCRIYRFQAGNSDGVDLGEASVNMLIQRNQIYYNGDKGVSMGAGSTATVRQNLIVGCAIGVGIKDAGSSAIIDQNTIVNCGEGVAIYEKHFGGGGGNAVITNTIISKASIAPLTVDDHSTVTIAYSLSDTTALSGPTNLLADPRFVDPVLLNFQLQADSPAINTGDPAHPLDPDGTIADRGYAYLYQQADYPYTIGETVVINEILANSGSAPDWIELYNRTQGPVDISDWFLSDDGTNLAKYRIPAGTILPADGYVTFYEDLNFGAASIDPNKVTPFALSDIGETVYLSSGVNNDLTDYRSKENFGASAEGETLGCYYKPSSDSYNFVAMARPTPGTPNSGPRMGPIVISEIMYNPPGSADGEEFLELLNVTNAPVTLYDAAKQLPWRMTDGIDFDFPTNPPVTLAAGERILLVRNLASFGAAFGASTTRKFQWTAGALDNAGETVQLAKPGSVDALNVTQYIRIDRVNYDDTAPWPTSPDGSGPALTKISEADYGNDFINWRAVTASPGGTPPGPTFATWAAANGVTTATGDEDGDGLSNLMEYALGTNPTGANVAAPLTFTREGNQLAIAYGVNVQTPDVAFQVEGSNDLTTWTRLDSTPVSLSATSQTRMAWDTTTTPRRFYRLSTRLLASPAP